MNKKYTNNKNKINLYYISEYKSHFINWFCKIKLNLKFMF